MFAFADIRIDFLEDDENGYLLISHIEDQIRNGPISPFRDCRIFEKA